MNDDYYSNCYRHDFFCSSLCTGNETLEYSELNSYQHFSSIGTAARCGLWPVEQYGSIFFLSINNSLHLLTPSTWRSFFPSSFHSFLGLRLRLVPFSSWMKIFLGNLSSFLSRWPNQLILCPFIHFTIFSPLLDRLCGLVVRVSDYRYRCLRFDSRRYQIFWVVVGLERGPLSLVRSIEELLE